MHEIEKLEEAAYFLSRMRASTECSKSFKFELSAFLSASRSILQYALEEAKTKPSGQKWYDAKVSSSRTAKFFKDRRDLNIHAKPIRPSQAIVVEVHNHIGVGDSLAITMTKENGTVISSQVEENMPARESKDTNHVEVATRYFLHEWTGPEDVIELALDYLDELARIVNDGKRDGFITT